MSPLGRTPAPPESNGEPQEGPEGDVPPGAERPLLGDRGIPSIDRARSLQSQVTALLAMVLIGVMGFGLLIWYYTHVVSAPLRARHTAQEASKNRAQGEMLLPQLNFPNEPAGGGATTPSPASSDTSTTPGTASTPGSTAGGMERLLGSRPPTPDTAATGSTPSGMAPSGTPTMPPPKTPGQLVFERRLAGPAFARVSRDFASTPQGALGSPADAPLVAAPGAPAAAGEPSGASAQSLGALLHPTVTPAVAAAVLPTRRFLLAKGTFIDCTLETAIDSTLPGMTTCITATDTFSADGIVVLLERGTKLIGETRGDVQQGSSRLFVLWTEARTPTGVVVPLASPGTDELGRSGLSGEVNRHFWDRFGAAILLTVINGAVQGAVNSENRGGSVVVSPSTSTDVMTELLRGTVSIAPTVTKAQGDRIQVFVARDVDFRSVYTLRSTDAAPTASTSPVAPEKAP